MIHQKIIIINPTYYSNTNKNENYSQNMWAPGDL
jgi:hypothetical protein